MAIYPDVHISRGGCEIDYSFECPTRMCKYALCEIMPPEPDDKCASNWYGSCKCVEAQIAALKALSVAIGTKLKKLRNESE